MKQKHEKPTPPKHVVIVGLGATGSQLVPLVTAMEQIAALTLVDRDVYEAKNRSGQAIRASDVNNAKVEVQAARAQAIRGPDKPLKIHAIHDSIENVPFGWLRADLILACLDSKLARQIVNQFAWRLGIPWVDSGVNAEGMLARVNVYVPSVHNPCLECAWDQRHYDTLEVARPCQPAGSAVAPTNAPAHLGSLAASLQATECHKILAGSWHSVAVGKQILIDANTHKLYETVYRRNPKCRFNHHTWRIHRLRNGPSTLTLGATLSRMARLAGSDHGVTVGVEGKSFHIRLRCACGEQKPVLRLQGRMPASERSCPQCGKCMDSGGFDMLPRLDVTSLSGEQLDRPLASIGFKRGDVFSARTSLQERHYEVIND